MVYKRADLVLPNGIIRNCTLLLRKLQGKGTPVEVKKILGWLINFHLLTIALPELKKKKWINIIMNLLQLEEYRAKVLE